MFHAVSIPHSICAIVCDGAGSAPFGGEGASIICRVFSLGLREHFQSHTTLPTDEAVWTWIDDARDSLAAAAERRDTRRQAFASTLVLLVAIPDAILVAHVGDGAVVARRKDGGWVALSWPENGEYASTTFFLTDDPTPRVRITRHDPECDAFAIFSDGIEDLALDHRSQTPHEPFFRSMLAPLGRVDSNGRNLSLCNALAGFLDSDRVCDRTNDDKSLILISSR